MLGQRMWILGAVAGALVLAAAQSSMAGSIAITDGSFEQPQTNSYALFDSNPSTMWVDGNSGNAGVAVTSQYLNSPDPDGGTQTAWIAGGYIAQQIGALNPSATYTINFYGASGSGLTDTVELVDGSPTGTVLASQSFVTVPGSYFTPYSAVLTPSGGSSGDPLYLEFVTSGYQTYIDDVTASYTTAASTVPEPGSLGLLSLGAAGLLAAARRRRLA